MMKGIAFQLIASSLALTVMAGMVGMHWWKLGALENPGSGADLQALAAPADAPRAMMPVSTGAAATEPATPGEPVVPESVHSVTVQALQEVVSVLKEMKAENEELRGELSELYEGMNSLELQLDMRSDDFKVLQLAPTPEGVYNSGNPLLPPKSW